MVTSSVHSEAQQSQKNEPAPSSFTFERRRAHRYIMSGRVTMMRRGHDVSCYQQPICCVQLQDLSDSGVAAFSDVPLQINEPVAVFFPPRGPQQGVDLLGHVVRCERAPGSDEYRFAVAFDYRPAA